jgi:cell division septum initiation protein DivIVA
LTFEKEIGDRRSLSDSLEEKVSGLSQRSETLSEENIKAERKLEEVNRTIQQKTELVRKVKEAEDLGLRPSQLGVIVETACKAGARHGLSIKDSLDRLAKDLEENWEPKLGFEIDKTRLTSELGQLNEKIRLAEGKERLTMEKVRAQEEALRGLEELRKVVSSSELVEFKKIIVDSGQDISTFRSEVERLGNVTEAVGSVIEKKVAVLNKLEGSIVTLKAQESKLIDQKRALEGEIITLSSNAVKSIIAANNIIHDVADGLKADFEDPVNGYRVRIKVLGDKAIEDVDVELKGKREELRRSLESLSSFVTRSANEVENLRKNTWEPGKLVGSSVHLARLARIVGGEKVGTVEGVATMKMAVDSFTDYLTRNNLASKCPSATMFSAELRSIIT